MTTATKRLKENITEFVKHWACSKVIVREDGLLTRERKHTVSAKLRTAYNMQKVSYMYGTFISDDDSYVLANVTEKLGYANDCYIE